MPRPEYEPSAFLTKRGRKIFQEIVKHIKDLGVISDIDTHELSMLANSFDLFQTMTEKCNKEDGTGYTEEVTGKNGTFKQVVPEYTIMRNEYNNILKHSSKFGLNPGDREKIFSNVKKGKKTVSVTDGLD